MKILVIPDVHLKPVMFEQAARLMNSIPAKKRDDIDAVIETINGFDYSQMWQDLVLYERRDGQCWCTITAQLLNGKLTIMGIETSFWSWP